jgi:hypothetical protein
MLGFWKFMALSDKEEPTTIIGHVLLGLHRESLIGGAYAAGDLETIRAFAPKAEQPGIVLEPTGLGANFFLWAMGRGDVPLQRFFAEDAVCGIDTQLPELPLAVPAG